jgi:site-specific DNA-methyltransferase (adenine-specific)
MITITNEDCMDLMKRFNDKHFDLAIVDPPYFDGPSTSNFYGGKLKNKFRSPGRYPGTSFWEIPGIDYYRELLRVSKEQIIFGINYFNFENVPPGRIVWDKKNDSSTFSHGEIASCSLIKSVRFFRYLWHGFLQENPKNKEIRIHSTQKPVALYKWILNNFAINGWCILDTHFGSGSSAIACHDFNFNLTACEIDKIIFTNALKRLKDHQNQTVLNFNEGN